MSKILRALTLLALVQSAGCLGPLELGFTDNWMTSWKFQDEKVTVDDEKLKDGRISVTGKDAFSAAFVWVPLELGDGALVHGTFRFEKPDKITGDALTGFQIQPLGPEAPLFFLVQSLLLQGDLILNIFAQSGQNLVFQKTVMNQESVALEVQVDATDFHFFVDGVKEGQTPIPNPAVDWVAGYGFSGLGVGERVSLDRAHVRGGAGKPGHTPTQQVKRSIFAASEPMQTLLDENDGKKQTPQDTLAGVLAARAAVIAARAEANTKLTDAKEKKAVDKDLASALKRIEKLRKFVEKKIAKNKPLKQKKIRKDVAKILRTIMLAALRISTPPFQTP